MKRFLVSTLLLMSILLVPSQTAAQDSIAVAGGCTVDPMPRELIDRLASEATTPGAAVTPTPIDFSRSQPISKEARTALTFVIRQSELCAHQQDLPRLLSLFTERFIVEQFFANEPVRIQAISLSTPIQSQISPIPTDQEDMLMDAVLLPDGRIAANVSSNAWGGNQQLYLFELQDGNWLIDEIRSSPGPLATGGASNVTVPPDAEHIAELVLQDAASQLGVDLSSLSITTIEAVEWPDSALGCPEEGGVYAQVISPGYLIIVTNGAQTLEYHTGLNDAFVICQG